MTSPRTIWVILRSDPAGLPPVMSLLHVLLADLGYQVGFISSASSGLLSSYDRLTEFIIPRPALAGVVGKATQYLQFRRFVTQTLSLHANPNDLVWYASLDTALALLGSSLFAKHPYILQLHELYDTHPRRLQLIGPIARAARHVVVPESNRAAILEVWLKLGRRPTVLPNKPYHHPRQRRLAPSSPITQSILHRFPTTKPILLYQGHISADRDLMPFAMAMRGLPEMQLWLMGRDHGNVDELTAVSENISFLGFVPPPLHLEITSYASIGIMKYDPVSLNNLFCAPNKIWEYSGFGIPFIANDCPSLVDFTRSFRCGITLSDDSSVTSDISNMFSNISDMSENCLSMFDSINLSKIVDTIIGPAS